MSSSKSRFADVFQRNTSRLLAFAAFGFIGYTAVLIVGNKLIFPAEKKKVVSFHEAIGLDCFQKILIIT